MNGFLIIDKPKGPTSQQVISQLKKILNLKKVGHTGTLDPLATGVLPVALGEATKVIPYLDESIKIYRVRGELGLATDTYDAQGQVMQRANSKSVSEALFLEKLKAFLGEQDQLPPPYSAIKFQGKPLYAYAREGKEAPLKARRIFIHQLTCEFFENPNFAFQVSCSRGTYVRSLVHDLGRVLGCFAYVQEIRRLQTGPFTIGNATEVTALLADSDEVMRRVLSIENCLSHLPQLELESLLEYSKVKSGAGILRVQKQLNQEPFIGKTVTLKYQNLIVALVRGEEGNIRYQRVLNRFS